MPEIKTQPGLGLIEVPQGNPLRTFLDWNVTDSSLSILGSFTDSQAIVFPIEKTVTSIGLLDGYYRLMLGIESETGSLNIKLQAASPLFPDFTFQPIQLLAGYGVGIQVQDEKFIGDIYVLETVATENEPVNQQFGDFLVNTPGDEVVDESEIPTEII